MKDTIQKAKRGNGGGWNKGIVSVGPRKCEACSRVDRKVVVYPKWKMTLCQKHYWHMRLYGKILWGDERPYRTRAVKRLKASKKAQDWRKKIFERDNYTCQTCGERGGKLEAHHIKPFAYFPKLRWIISNGVTLCIPCHRKTDSWGRKGQKIYGKSN